MMNAMDLVMPHDCSGISRGITLVTTGNSMACVLRFICMTGLHVAGLYMWQVYMCDRFIYVTGLCVTGLYVWQVYMCSGIYVWQVYICDRFMCGRFICVTGLYVLRHICVTGLYMWQVYVWQVYMSESTCILWVANFLWPKILNLCKNVGQKFWVNFMKESLPHRPHRTFVFRPLWYHTHKYYYTKYCVTYSRYMHTMPLACLQNPVKAPTTVKGVETQTLQIREASQCLGSACFFTPPTYPTPPQWVSSPQSQEGNQCSKGDSCRGALDPQDEVEEEEHSKHCAAQGEQQQPGEWREKGGGAEQEEA